MFKPGNTYNPGSASYPRRLGKQIARAMIVHPEGISRKELREWAYPNQEPKYWHALNVWRHLRAWNYERVRHGVWRLRQLED